MIVSGYSMDLYCDDPRHDQAFKLKIGQPGSCCAQFYGETYGECAKQARRRGWRLSRDQQTCVCPHHSGKRRKRSPLDTPEPEGR